MIQRRTQGRAGLRVPPGDREVVVVVVDVQTQVVPAVWEVDAPVVTRYPSEVLADVTAWVIP